MITYKEFIKLMEKRGYSRNGVDTINESYPNLKTFTVKRGSVGKIVELNCPDNTIISACGKHHPGGCEKLYNHNIKCYNEHGKEPFQGLHYSTKLTDKQHVVAEIVASKILQQDPNKIDPNYNEWLIKSNPILKLIGSENRFEHIMWIGAYKLFSKDFMNESFNIHSNEKMILYIINPDIDITKIKFELKVDILSLNTRPT